MSTIIGSAPQSGLASLPGMLGAGFPAAFNSTYAKMADPLGVGNALFGTTQYQPDPLSQQLASLSRSQWGQAANLMYPAQSQLINYAENPNAIAQTRSQAQAGVDSSFAAQAGARQRLFELLGINPSAAQSAALGKQDTLSKAAAEAGAMNQATASTYKTQQAALQGFQ